MKAFSIAEAEKLLARFSARILENLMT